MASRADVLLCALVIVAFFCVNIVQFISSDSMGIMLNDSNEIVPAKGTFVYSSLWNSRANFSTVNRKSRAKPILNPLLILMCGDIETCPGPKKCSLCMKAIRRNQSSCSSRVCLREFHLKCFHESDQMGVCLECYNMAGIGNEFQTDQCLSDIPVMHGLHEILKARGMKILHQNICGLVAKASHIEYILMNFKNIHVHTKRKTHLSDENVLSSITGYNFVNRNRQTGSFGGVAARAAERIRGARGKIISWGPYDVIFKQQKD